MNIIPVSVLIPTVDRPEPLARTIESMLAGTAVPAQFVIIDGSAGPESATVIRALFPSDCPRADLRPARAVGAAVQRNQACALATEPFVLFADDDILCEPDCLERLWNAIQSDSGIGGAGASIVNQSYARPGRMMRLVLAAIGEPERDGYAGRIFGPAIAFLPALRPGGIGRSDVVPVQWLNTTCTLYRRNCLPDPAFDSFFSGYSIGEDITLSLRVARTARLVNVPGARIYHDSQPGVHKADVVALSRMDLVNRHYIVTKVMMARGWRDQVKLLLWECCQLAICAIQQRGGATFRMRLRGKFLGLVDIMRSRRDGASLLRKPAS